MKGFSARNESGSFPLLRLGQIVLDPDEAESSVRGWHQGVPPDGAVVAVTELQSPDVASQQQIKTFREGDGGDFRDVCGCGVFGDDLHQFGMGGDILKKLAECGFIEFGW